MQIPIDPVAGSMVRTGVRAQARRVIDNIKGIMEANGGTLANLVKLNLYLRQASDLEQVNIVMADMLQQNPPARSTVVAAGLPKDAALAMDAVAYLGA